MITIGRRRNAILKEDNLRMNISVLKENPRLYNGLIDRNEDEAFIHRRWGLGEDIIDAVNLKQNHIINALHEGKDALNDYFVSVNESLHLLTTSEARMEALTMEAAMEAVVDHIRVNEHNSVEVTFTGASIFTLLQAKSTQQVSTRLWMLVERFLEIFRHCQLKHNRSLIDKSILFIHQNYSESCSLQEVADHVHLSPAYYSHHVKKVMGIGFSQYVSRYRMEKASLLISRTSRTVSEIANEVGFDDPNYFATVFKQNYGISPSKYRNQ
jgi:two-component system response regulator YesN